MTGPLGRSETALDLRSGLLAGLARRAALGNFGVGRALRGVFVVGTRELRVALEARAHGGVVLATVDAASGRAVSISSGGVCGVFNAVGFLSGARGGVDQHGQVAAPGGSGVALRVCGGPLSLCYGSHASLPRVRGCGGSRGVLSVSSVGFFLMGYGGRRAGGHPARSSGGGVSARLF